MIPTDDDILRVLDDLESRCADDLETHHLDFKRWKDVKASLKTGTECAACFANADGGVVVFGVDDKPVGRSAAIHGTSGFDVDRWRHRIYESTRPNLDVQVGELHIPEGTDRLLVVRIRKGLKPPYCTSSGLYQKRVETACLPMDAEGFTKAQITAGAVDWSGAPAAGVEVADLDPVELGRARNILRAKAPESPLLTMGDPEFLRGLGAVRG